MLPFKKFLNRVKSANMADLLGVVKLREKLAEYGQEGIDKMIAAVEDEQEDEETRCKCFVVLGADFSRLGAATRRAMECSENAAMTKTSPALAELALQSVYFNAWRGRAEAVFVVETFRMGDPEHRAIFMRVDHYYQQEFYLMQVAMSQKDKVH